MMLQQPHTLLHGAAPSQRELRWPRQPLQSRNCEALRPHPECGVLGTRSGAWGLRPVAPGPAAGLHALRYALHSMRAQNAGINVDGQGRCCQKARCPRLALHRCICCLAASECSHTNAEQRCRACCHMRVVVDRPACRRTHQGHAMRRDGPAGPDGQRAEARRGRWPGSRRQPLRPDSHRACGARASPLACASGMHCLGATRRRAATGRPRPSVLRGDCVALAPLCRGSCAPVAAQVRLKILDAIRLHAVPSPMFKLKRSWQIPTTSLCLHTSFLQPLDVRGLRQLGKTGAPPELNSRRSVGESCSLSATAPGFRALEYSGPVPPLRLGASGGRQSITPVRVRSARYVHASPRVAQGHGTSRSGAWARTASLSALTASSCAASASSSAGMSCCISTARSATRGSCRRATGWSS